MQCRANTRGVGMRCYFAGLIAFPLPGHSGHGDWQDESSCNHYLHHAKFKWNYVSLVEILTVILCLLTCTIRWVKHPRQGPLEVSPYVRMYADVCSPGDVMN